jgi:hypothetical protein
MENVVWKFNRNLYYFIWRNTMKQNHDITEPFEGMELIEETLLNNINGAGNTLLTLITAGCKPT